MAAAGASHSTSTKDTAFTYHRAPLRLYNSDRVISAAMGSRLGPPPWAAASAGASSTPRDRPRSPPPLLPLTAPMSPPSKAFATAAGMVRARLRSSIRTRSGGYGEGAGRWTSPGTQERPNGYLFKRTPPPPEQSREWEDWELPCYITSSHTSSSTISSPPSSTSPLSTSRSAPAPGLPHPASAAPSRRPAAQRATSTPSSPSSEPLSSARSSASDGSGFLPHLDFLTAAQSTHYPSNPPMPAPTCLLVQRLSVYTQNVVSLVAAIGEMGALREGKCCHGFMVRMGLSYLGALFGGVGQHRGICGVFV